MRGPDLASELLALHPAPPLEGLADAHGRSIRYMRLSLTDRCNFRCVYCMPPEGLTPLPHAEVLSYEELLRFCRLSAALGISRYKITGGEPLCRKGALDFIHALKTLPGVRQVSLTTNAALLRGALPRLAALGLDGINISLDTLNPKRYRAITASSALPDEAVAALQEARGLGLTVKINAVPVAGYNDGDLVPLARFALEQGCFVRFIELMPVGQARAFAGLSQAQIRRDMEEAFGPLTPLAESIGNGPAEHFTVAGYSGGIGFISALSKKFCRSCNRVRLTAAGFLKVCLHHETGRDMKALLRGNLSDEELARAIRGAIWEKPLAHSFEEASAPGGPRAFFMSSVGG